MKKYKVGYTTGVYDMFHIGHLNILKNAKEYCDYLIVGVTTDELVSHKNKKAIIPHEERMAIVENIKCVDQAVPQESMDKMAAWEKYKFDVMFVGSDWKGTDKWNEFERQFGEVGVDIVYFPYTQGTSSTKLREALDMIVERKMSSKKLVSIIVPVYNAEKYLDKCINSILDQTYHNIELILVNDGSTDRSEQICLEYAKNDNRISYLRQTNAGPSTSRNNGILKSKGNYIQFLDADDYLDANSVDTLVNAIRDVDYVIAGYYNISESPKGNSKKLVTSSMIGTYLKEDLLPYWGELVEEEVFHYTWNKLYKSEFIKDHIRFNENIKISEDMLFNLDYLSNINRIKIINEPIYHHVLYNQESLTKRYHNGLFEMRKITHQYMEAFLKSNSVYQGNNCRVVKELYAKRIKTIFIHLCSPKTQMNNSEKLNIIDQIVNDNSVRSVVKSFDSRLITKLTANMIVNKRAKSIFSIYSMIAIMLSIKSKI